MKVLDVITWLLLIIGGLNWGSVALFNFDFVAAIFGQMTVASRVVYVLVALSALYDLIAVRAIQHRWAYEPRTIHGTP